MTEKQEPNVSQELVAQEDVQISVEQYSYQTTTFGEIESGFFFLTPRFELAIKVGESSYILPGIKDYICSLESTVRIFKANIKLEAKPILS